MLYQLASLQFMIVGVVDVIVGCALVWVWVAAVVVEWRLGSLGQSGHTALGIPFRVDGRLVHGPCLRVNNLRRWLIASICQLGMVWFARALGMLPYGRLKKPVLGTAWVAVATGETVVTADLAGLWSMRSLFRERLESLSSSWRLRSRLWLRLLSLRRRSSRLLLRRLYRERLLLLLLLRWNGWRRCLWL